MPRRLTAADFSVPPAFTAGDIDAQWRIWIAVRGIVNLLDQDPERADRTTFAMCEVETASAQRETWIAGAGKDGRVPRRFRSGDMLVKHNLHAQGARGNHLNDAEGKLIRQAISEGVTIVAIGASREMCPVCQTAAFNAGCLDRVVTPIERN